MALDASRLKGVEVDVCSYCNGVWLDSGELTQLSGLSADLAGATPTAFTDPLACPHCATAMTRYRMGSVEVDQCPSCQGIWLDTDELKTVLQQAVGTQPRQAPQVGRVLARARETTARPAAPAAAPELVLTTISPPADKIARILGVVSGDALMGQELIDNSLAHVRGFASGDQAGFGPGLCKVRELAMAEASAAGKRLGATAVVGVSLQHNAIGGGGLLVTAVGTAVVLR